MRGGTSRGPLFLASDLPSDRHLREQVLRSSMEVRIRCRLMVSVGSPAHLKAASLPLSASADVDLNFTFVQLQPETTSVQTTQNCGNMLAAVVPFAVETGLINPTGDITEVLVRTTNTGLLSRISVRTPEFLTGNAVCSTAVTPRLPGWQVRRPRGYSLFNTAGSIASALLPTGNITDVVEANGSDYTATLIDNGQPLVILDARDLGLTGYETVDELTDNTDLKARIEALRLVAAQVMGLGDVTDARIQKMTLVAPPQVGGAIATRSFIPHRVHESIGVLAAVTVATALLLDGSVANRVGTPGSGTRQTVGIEHPSGIFDALVDLDGAGTVVASGNTRTARLISRGEVYVPASVWDPSDTAGF